MQPADYKHFVPPGLLHREAQRQYLGALGKSKGLTGYPQVVLTSSRSWNRQLAISHLECRTWMES
jgi:hypothetical protein